MKRLIALATWFIVFSSSPAYGQLSQYQNSIIFAQDSANTYLGKASSNRFEADSITNAFGAYGSSFSNTSIRNTFSSFGSSFANFSAYNSFTARPPILYTISGGRYVAQAYLTKNTFLSPRVDPDALFAYLQSLGSSSAPTTAILMSGTYSYAFSGSTVTFGVEAISNYRPEGTVSGTLALQLWATTTVYTGENTLYGFKIIEVPLGTLQGQFWVQDLSRSGIINSIPSGNYNIVFVLAESNGSVFTTVDYGNFEKRQDFGVTVVAPSIGTQPSSRSAAIGERVIFSVGSGATTNPIYQWYKNGAAILGADGSSYTIASVQASDTGAYSVAVKNSAGSVTSNTAQLTVNLSVAAPTISTQPTSQTVTAGAGVSLTIAASGLAPISYQWLRNGLTLGGATNPTLSGRVEPEVTGIYSVVVTNSEAAIVSQPAIVGITSANRLIGPGTIFPDIFHAGTGFTYDQVLLGGAAASVTADSSKGKILRMSYIDLNDDIVQVEFSGAGTLSLVLEVPTGPAIPLKYNQATTYMKGHAGIVLAGANATTNLSVFSVGRVNAANQALFSSDVTYNGVADLAFIAITSTDGRFGGLRAANANFWNTNGYTGIYAPNVQFTGPVFVSNINAFFDATPVIVIGSGSDVRVTGGDLLQDNGRAVQVNGITQLKFTAGSSSHGTLFSAKPNRARLEKDGTDVTSQVVVNP
jgi:Immunoglobulin domain